MPSTKTVDEYIEAAGHWQAELTRLREVLLGTALVEQIKWGAPCYTHSGKNVVGIAGFKSYFGLWFHQGALLKDQAQVLISAQEGTTKALRQWRMSCARDIKPAIIKRYVKEAIALVDAGREIKADRSKPLVIPPELQKALRRTKGATAAFNAMSKGCQREYAEHIAQAKRPETRERRIAKIVPMIITGGGLHDKYKKP